MAKKLEELGISPTPWAAEQGDNSWRVFCEGRGLVLIDDEYGEEYEGANLNEAEARLIASAPDLYECLLEAVEDKCEACKSSWYGDCVTADGNPCSQVKRWREALAKASGEEVSNG